MLFPADHVIWSVKIADAATWLDEPVGNQAKRAGLQLWILGNFSRNAQAGLQEHGWELYPNAQSKLM